MILWKVLLHLCVLLFSSINEEKYFMLRRIKCKKCIQVGFENWMVQNCIVLNCRVKIEFYFPLLSVLLGNSDQITNEEAFCKAKALCEHKIISSSSLFSAQESSHIPIAVTWHSPPRQFWWDRRRESMIVVPVKVDMPAVGQYNGAVSKLLNELHVTI